ncbi:hypothetical protein ACK3BK_12405 [Pseudomonas sp. L7]|uniref:hypothetical protein n=1 Tax=Pseudomonas sp. L7 TaxID=3388343 RepID=UPI0039848D8E
MWARNIQFTSAMLAVALLNGCASIIGDSKYPVTIASTPPEASFDIVNRSGQVIYNGVTPTVVTLQSGERYFRGETYTLRFKKEGYPDRQVELDSSVSGWYWGNLLLGGVIGMLIVDPITGAMYKLPERVSTDMGAKVSIAPNQLQISTVDDLSPEQRAQLVQIK